MLEAKVLGKTTLTNSPQLKIQFSNSRDGLTSIRQISRLSGSISNF